MSNEWIILWLLKEADTATYCHELGAYVTIEGVFDNWIYWPLTSRTTINYNTIAIYTFYSSLLHALMSSVYYSLHYLFSSTGI
jgi:hypothetical protein